MVKSARRGLTLGAVLALHAGLLSLMLWGLRYLHAVTAPALVPIELVKIAPPDRTPEPFTRTHRPAPPALILSIPSPDTWLARVPRYAAPSGEAGSGTAIDWEAEAKHEVNLYSRRGATPPARRHGSPVYRYRLDTPHHAGDVVALDAETSKVYVSEFCFQIAARGPNPAAEANAPIRCEVAAPPDYRKLPVETTTEETM